MSRYVLRKVKPFREMVIGWDPPIEGYFLQAFEGRKESPTIWRPRLELDELQAVLGRLGVALPDLLRRVLAAEKNGSHVEWRPGDLAHLEASEGDMRLVSFRVRAVSESEAGSPLVLLGIAEGLTLEVEPFHVHPRQIYPDLESIGVE